MAEEGIRAVDFMPGNVNVRVLADELVEEVAVWVELADDGESDPLLSVCQGEGSIVFPANLWRRFVAEVDAELAPEWRALTPSPSPDAAGEGSKCAACKGTGDDPDHTWGNGDLPKPGMEEQHAACQQCEGTGLR